MRLRARHLGAALLALVIGTTAVAQVPREVHGSADAYAAPGVALAWAVLRGATEATTLVVIRVAADPRVYGAVAAVGKDPFTQQAEPLLPRTPTALAVDIRVPRARFADLPRTEIMLYGDAAAGAAPGLVVYYLGVPDTTPEVAGEAALNASLDDRIARAIAAARSKPP